MPSIRFITQFDNFTLKLEYIEDQYEKAIDKREFPGLDGSENDDLGMKGTVYRFRAIFWKSTYESHKDFLTAAQAQNVVHNFVHPVHGLIYGIVRSIAVRYDEKQEIAFVDVSFEEQLQGDFESALSPLIVPQVESYYTTAQASQIQSFVDSANQELLGEDTSFLSESISGNNFLSQYSGLSRNTRKWVRNCELFVSKVESTLSTIEAPANSIIQTIDYGSNLPGRVIGAVAGVVERYSVAVGAMAGSPVRFFDTFFSSLNTFRNSFSDNLSSIANQIKLAAALFGGLSAAYVYEDDEKLRDKVKSSEQQQPFDILGNYRGSEYVDNVMTVNDLEKSLYLVRKELQEAITINRDLPELPAISFELLNFVNSRKIERDKIVKTRISSSIPVQLLCHKFGQSYQSADRVHNINMFVNPLFVSGDVSIYVR